MRKDVLNYLQEIDNSFVADNQNWGLESPILFDLRHRKKRPCLAKATAIGLAASAVITGTMLTACEKNTTHQLDDSNITTSNNEQSTISLPKIELKTPEQIKDDGIESKDVSDAYASLAQDFILKNQIPVSSADSMQFKQLTNNTEMIDIKLPDGSDYTLALDLNSYVKYDAFPVDNPIYKNVYVVNCHLNGVTLMNLIVDAASFEQMMQSFGIEKTQFSTDMLNPAFQQYGDSVSFLIGKDAYPKFAITPETFTNASDDQLWALYNMFDSMQKINVEGLQPSEHIAENELVE